MRAAIIRGYGGPEVFTIEEVERPRPGAGQLGIRVHASSVNPVDCGIRSGALRAFVRLRLPAILGIDYAGVVEEVGPDVEGFAVGDEVFGFVDIRSCGAYAEHAVVAASTAARKPSALSFTEAGVIGGAGLTAFQALTQHLAVKAGARVLVNGGGGGVGTFTIQIARALGCHVTATGSTSKLELLRELGADEALDYTKVDPFAARGAYDATVDCVGNIGLWAARRLLAPGGRHVVIAAGPGAMLRSLLGKLAPGKPFISFLVAPRGADGEAVAALVEAGKLEVVLDRRFPLAQLGEAHAYVERGRTAGKVAIEIP